MKDRYEVKSERYGHTHSFVQLPNGRYTFVPEKDWMPLYITGEHDDIKFIDTEGGPCIGVGFYTNEVRVKSIRESEDKVIEIELEEINKTEE